MTVNIYYMQYIDEKMSLISKCASNTIAFIQKHKLTVRANAVSIGFRHVVYEGWYA